MINQLTAEQQAALLGYLSDFALPIITEVRYISSLKNGEGFAPSSFPLAVTFSTADCYGEITFYVDQTALLQRNEVVVYDEVVIYG